MSSPSSRWRAVALAITLNLSIAVTPARAGSQASIELDVDEARYARPYATVNVSTPRVTRESYLKTIQDVHERLATPRLSWLESDRPYPDVDANLQAGVFYAFRYRFTGDERLANFATSFLEQALLVAREMPLSRLTTDVIHRAHRAWSWLEGSRALTPDARKNLRELLILAAPAFPATKVETGSFNRAFAWALQGEILLHYVPDAPDADRWRELVDGIWEEFWSVGDYEENSSHYEAFNLRLLLDWIELRDDPEHSISHPVMRTIFERIRIETLPIGSLPNFGDGYGWNVSWGHWLPVLESAGRVTRDGRYRYAAQRIFVYSLTHIENLFSWATTGTEAIESMMRAVLVMDDDVAPVPPDDDVAVTQRSAIRPVPSDYDRRGGMFLVATGPRIPSKLRMQSGSDPTSAALLVDLSPAAGHGHPISPGIIAFVDAGSVLLTDQGYGEKAPEYHHTFQIEDYEGIPLDPATERTEVLETSADADEVRARVRVENLRGYPADLERSLVLSRSGPLLVHDAITFRVALRVRVGPVFNFAFLGPEIGDTAPGASDAWVNGYLGDRLPSRGLGVNAKVYTWWKNPPRDLLIRFATREGADLRAWNLRDTDSTLPLPRRVQQRYRGRVQAGQTLSFTSVLVPHVPTRKPGRIAAGVAITPTSAGHVSASVATESGRVVELRSRH